jgi:hypothetical protein
MAEHGYDGDSFAFSYLKRCSTCAQTLTYPWAGQLELSRVLAFLESDKRCRGAFALALLRETIREQPDAESGGGFKYL